MTSALNYISLSLALFTLVTINSVFAQDSADPLEDSSTTLSADADTSPAETKGLGSLRDTEGNIADLFGAKDEKLKIQPTPAQNDLGIGNENDLEESIKLFAATPTPDKLDSLNLDPSQTPKDDTEPLHGLGVLDLEEHIASGRFAAKSGIEERAVLVRVYERISLAVCFPPISYLIKGEKLETVDPRCKESLEKLSKLHSNNTILICAKEGVDSVECARSFETQYVRKYKSGESEKLNLTGRSSNPLNSQEINERYLVLHKKLLEDIDKIKSEFSVSNLKNLDSSLYSVLNIICNDDALELSSEPPESDSDSNLNSLSDAFSLSSAIEDLQKKNKKTQPTPVPELYEEGVYFRSRLLSAQCYDSINDALNIDNRLSSAICFKQGFIAPACISSLRRIQSLKDSPKDNAISIPNIAPKQQKDSLDTF